MQNPLVVVIPAKEEERISMEGWREGIKDKRKRKKRREGLF